MVAVLFLVLLTSVTWGADWYLYYGTLSQNWRAITGQTDRFPEEVYVMLSYDTTPWSISVESPGGIVLWSGEFDREGTKVQFRASGGGETIVGRGSFNARVTTLNLQGWAFVRDPGGRSWFGQLRFRGEFVDIISR
jgi:hypothetical protein